ncbi:microrchidia 2-like protein [Tanacetum coccineum]
MTKKSTIIPTQILTYVQKQEKNIAWHYNLPLWRQPSDLSKKPQPLESLDLTYTIKLAYSVTGDGNSKDYRFVGVLEANSIEPAHDKHDFERSGFVFEARDETKTDAKGLLETSTEPLQTEDEPLDQTGWSRDRTVFNNDRPIVQDPPGFDTVGSLWATKEAENTLGWNEKIGEDHHEGNKFEQEARHKQKFDKCDKLHCFDVLHQKKLYLESCKDSQDFWNLYDSSRYTESGEKGFQKFDNYSSIVGGERLDFNPFGKIIDGYKPKETGIKYFPSGDVGTMMAPDGSFMTSLEDFKSFLSKYTSSDDLCKT